MLKKINSWLKDKKGSFVGENLGWLLLALVILVVGFIVIMVLTGKADGALNFIRDLFRFKKV